MAKISMKARKNKREQTIAKFKAKREAIKQRLQRAYIEEGEESPFELQLELQKLPRNASPSRLQRRCSQCGRPHAVYRKFNLCRICIRKLGMLGLIPGLKKASW